MNRLCFLPLLLEGGGVGRCFSGGCSRSHPGDFESLSTKPSVNCASHSGTFRNRLPDAVCRTRSPEAELLLVSAEPTADTETFSYLVTLGAAYGTKLSDLQGIISPSLFKFGDCPSLHAQEYRFSGQGFPKDNTVGESSKSGKVTNMSRSVT